VAAGDLLLPLRLICSTSAPQRLRYLTSEAFMHALNHIADSGSAPIAFAQ
jgi:hypothetical protein